MALVIADRVRESSTTTGTGTFVLAGAVVGYQSFSTAIGNTNTTYYTISNPGTTEWEVGIGTISTGSLTRTTVISSSNANALVAFTAGTKDVFVTYPAEKAVYQDASGNVTASGTFSGAFSGSVAATTLSASSTVSGVGFSTYLASPPAIGSTAASTGAFTTLSASSTVSGVGFSTYLASPPAIGSTAASTGAFTTLSASSTVTLSGGTANGVAYLNASKVLTTGSGLVFDGTTLNFGGTAQRITGDFNNATISSRVLFQSSTTNGQTRITALPNGTETGSALDLFNSATPSNSSRFSIRTGSADMSILSTIEGTGTYLPMTFQTGGSERMRIDTSGNVGIGSTSISSPNRLDVVATAADGRIACRTQNTSGYSTIEAQVNNYWTGPTYTGTAIVQYDSAATGTTLGLSNASLGVLRFQNGSGGLIYTNSVTPLVFGTASTERMRIDSLGNVGIGTSSPSASAILDAQSTAKGVRFPNMTTTQKNAISSPAAGLVVFDTTLSKLCVYTGAAWQTITSV
jgi:hypothetical protein